MRIAIFSDLHGHIYREFDRRSERSGSHRLDLIVDTLRCIRDYCLGNHIKHVFFAGDLFHVRARVNTVVFNAIYDELKEFHHYGLELLMIPGNHDQYDNSDVPQHSLHPFKELDGVTVIDDLAVHPLWDESGNIVRVFCVPYSKNAQRIKDWLASIDKDIEEGTNLCMFHLGISGGIVGNGSYPMADAFEVDDLRPDFFKYVFGGHFHKRQFLGGYPHVFYTGAPIQHSFGDEGEDKGFYIIDTAKRWDVKFVPIPNPQFITMNAYDLSKNDMQAIADEGNYVRIRVTEDESSKLVTLPDNLQYKMVIEKAYEETTRVDVKIGMTDEEVVGKYADEYNPKAKQIGLDLLREVKGV